MIKIIFLFFLLNLAHAQVETQKSYLKDPADFQGMLMLGRNSFYLSKLPMFHKPHDYQVLMEVTLDPKSEQKFLKKVKRHSGLFTFEPDINHNITDLVTNKKKMAGMIWAGHFERGGDRFLHVEVEIKNLLYFKKLNPSEPRREKYFIFGSGDDFYVGREITLRPGVDEYLKLAADDVPLAIVEELKEKKLIELDSLKFQDGKKLRIHEGQLIFEPAFSSYYRETTDLE